MPMLTRRSLLASLAALPLMGWMKPKQVDDLGGFVVPKHLETAVESIEGACIRGDRFVYRPSGMTLHQCALSRNIYLTPELVKDEDVKAAVFKAAFDRAFKESFGCP